MDKFAFRISPQKVKFSDGLLDSFCRETQNTTLNQAFGSFFGYFFLDKYVCCVAHIQS